MQDEGKGMLITVDAGNTSIFIGAHRCGKLLKTDRIAYGNLSRNKLEKKIVSFCKKTACRVSGAVISSVVPALNRMLNSVFDENFGVKALFVDSSSAGKMKLLYKKPGKLGADRIAVAAGAKELYGCPLIVVDFGTAVTFDFIDGKGNYRGGVIAPGMGLHGRALAGWTALLPLVVPGAPGRAIGKTTAACIKAGTFYGFMGSVKEIVSRMKKETGRGAKVIATGSYAGVVSSYTGIFDAVDYNLIHEGMRKILESRENRRNS